MAGSILPQISRVEDTWRSKGGVSSRFEVANEDSGQSKGTKDWYRSRGAATMRLTNTSTSTTSGLHYTK
ncbi:hypothetical protein EYF80_063573 [Liparis tanakae]|uniref:Uncharacterized protein n=1 Tax=Liparis tanakae TaxID=230148 RepID=A0A4Z2ECJ9_9TELE|nr:hypothetical protein EYF80_063573 [Liparis tanakae]